MELYYDYLQALQNGGRCPVRLPSDHLSPAALVEKNSPCRVYQLGRPMSAAQFRKLPRDLRRGYLQRLRSRGGSEEAVCSMMGLSPVQLRQLLQEYRVCLDRPDSAAWAAFVRLQAGV